MKRFSLNLEGKVSYKKRVYRNKLPENCEIISDHSLPLEGYLREKTSNFK